MSKWLKTHNSDIKKFLCDKHVFCTILCSLTPCRKILIDHSLLLLIIVNINRIEYYHYDIGHSSIDHESKTGLSVNGFVGCLSIIPERISLIELVWKTFGIIFDIFQDDTIDILQLANYLKIPTCLCLLECMNSYN